MVTPVANCILLVTQSSCQLRTRPSGIRTCYRCYRWPEAGSKTVRNS